MSAPTGSPRRPLVPRPERLDAIKLLGLGGVGGIVARYLVAWLGALGHSARVVLIDGDAFEPRNAERMLFSRCGNKAAVVRDDLLEHLRGSELLLSAVGEYADVANLPRLVQDGDLVLLAVDNHATRKLVADHCSRLDDICLISGGNDALGEDAAGHPVRGTCGNVQIQIRRDGRDASPRLDAFHPEIASPQDAAPGGLSCTQALLQEPQILFTNLATASAMLNALYLHACDALHYPELCFDIAEGVMRPIPLPAPRAPYR